MLATPTVGTGVGHVMVEASMEGGDAAIPGFLLQADVMRSVTVSGQVPRPVAIDAGSPAR